MLHAAWGGWLPRGVQPRYPAASSPLLSPSQHPWPHRALLEQPGRGAATQKVPWKSPGVQIAASGTAGKPHGIHGVRHLPELPSPAQQGRGTGPVGAAEASPAVRAAVAQRCLQTAQPGGSGTARAQPLGTNPALRRQSGAAPRSDAASAAPTYTARQRSWASDAWTCVKFT